LLRARTSLVSLHNKIGARAGGKEDRLAIPGEHSLSASTHQQLIESLAEQNRTPLERVRMLFDAEHARLQADARVKTYVTVIATRLVRNTLHAERSSEQY
jgi:hypothetical protein